MWQFPQALNPTGGLISSARDQLRYARFHLGDGTADDGTPVLMPSSLRAMRSDLGPGGTIRVEIDGVGVSWWQRRTAEGVPVYMHGGNWDGQSSGLLLRARARVRDDPAHQLDRRPEAHHRPVLDRLGAAPVRRAERSTRRAAAARRPPSSRHTRARIGIGSSRPSTRPRRPW